jgi:hypothetical protein
MNKQQLELAEKLAKEFLKDSLKLVSNAEDESLQYICAGYYFTENKKGFINNHSEFIIEAIETTSYSYWNPPESYEVEIGREKNLVQAIMFAAKVNLQIAMDGFCEAEHELKMEKEMDEGF